MLRWIDTLPYGMLIVIAILMLLLPFKPMPHALEKLIMLKKGLLTRPIDIFDLLFHLAPTIVLAIKLLRDYFH